jgi:hypothetical protein
MVHHAGSLSQCETQGMKGCGDEKKFVTRAASFDCPRRIWRLPYPQGLCENEELSKLSSV